MFLDDSKHKKHCQELFDDINPEFAGPDSHEQFMRASLFLSFLDLTLLMPLINSFYKVAEGVETYPGRAMVRCMFWRRIKGIKTFTEGYRYLKTRYRRSDPAWFQTWSGWECADTKLQDTIGTLRTNDLASMACAP